MTNRQSNIIFYSVISLIIYALIIYYAYPDFYEDFTKSQQEISAKEAVDQGEHSLALSLYQQIVEERIANETENSAETAAIYEQMAKLYLSTGNQTEEKNHYLKSLKIKKQLKKTSVLGLAYTYDKLGSIAEQEKNYDEAQMYYENALSTKLGHSPENTNKVKTEATDDGLFVGMQNSREQYLRLNNPETIATLSKLGEIHTIKNELHLAKQYYERALAASKETFGEDNAKTLEIKNTMGQLAL